MSDSQILLQILKNLAFEIQGTNRDLLEISNLSYTSNIFGKGIQQRIDRLDAIQKRLTQYDYTN